MSMKFEPNEGSKFDHHQSPSDGRDGPGPKLIVAAILAAIIVIFIVANSKVTVKGFYDLVNDAALFGNIRDGGSVLTYGPQGLVAAGDPARLVWVHDTAVAESSPVGGAVLVSSTFQGDAVVRVLSAPLSTFEAPPRNGR